jgi:hypothetical protein
MAVADFHSRPLFLIIAAAALACILQFHQDRKSENKVLPASYAIANGQKRLTVTPQSEEGPDTTAILLNWSRLPNVVRLVDTLCDPVLDPTIAQIVVWNNSPTKLTTAVSKPRSMLTFNLSPCNQHFSNTECVLRKLRIHNSPSNLYFQARFLACAESSTPFCFIQVGNFR